MQMTQECSDPDLNLQLLNDHGIYTIEEINELSRTVKPQYSFIHLNTRSLKQHFEQICNLLDSISCKFDFIGCSETWFTSETDSTSFQIPGYTLLCENRTFSTGGGVALYVRSDCSFSIRNDLKIDSVENLWIETDNMIVGVIYKPPNFSNLEFLDKLERTLHNVFLSKKKCVFMGDININTLTKTSVSKEYINLIQSEGFSQLIFEATRITENSQSCIDHIFTNISTPCSSGSLAVEIADHLPVFSILYDPKFSPFPDYLEFRDFRGFESENSN